MMNNYFEELGRIHKQDINEKSAKSSAMSFQLAENNLQKLDYLCKVMGINRSKLIHMLLEEKLFDALDKYMTTSERDIDQLDLNKNIKARFNFIKFKKDILIHSAFSQYYHFTITIGKQIICNFIYLNSFKTE